MPILLKICFPSYFNLNSTHVNIYLKFINILMMYKNACIYILVLLITVIFLFVFKKIYFQKSKLARVFKKNYFQKSKLARICGFVRISIYNN